MKRKILFVGTVVLLACRQGNAQTSTTKPPPNSFPCLTAPHRGDFDFWVGTWDVYASGTSHLLGHSRVSKAEGGCALLEQWNAAGGAGTGNSINFYDPASGYWVQVYVGSGAGNTTYTQGVYRDSAMHFSFESVLPGKKGRGQLTFYRVGPGEVRQVQDFRAEGSDSTVVQYDFTYRRTRQPAH